MGPRHVLSSQRTEKKELICLFTYHEPHATCALIYRLTCGYLFLTLLINANEKQKQQHNKPNNNQQLQGLTRGGSREYYLGWCYPGLSLALRGALTHGALWSANSSGGGMSFLPPTPRPRHTAYAWETSFQCMKRGRQTWTSSISEPWLFRNHPCN